MSLVNPNDPEWKGFAASMRTNPACDITRLAFADWLADHNFEAFARLIRAMVEVAQFDPHNRLNTWGWEDKKYMGLSRPVPAYAEAELCMKSVWAAWSPVKDLTGECRLEWWFHRGFPVKVVLDWRGLKWLDHLIALGPVGEVEVVGGSPVRAEVFPNTILFSLDDPAYHPRLGCASFVINRRDCLVGSYVPHQSTLYTLATTRFLNQLWGELVGDIKYKPRRNNFPVWPVTINSYQDQ